MRSSESFFFKCSAIWFLLLVFWGFAPSFYLADYFDPDYHLPQHLVLHGAVFSLWVLLYAIQVFLIGYKKYAMHRFLGGIGLVIMILMIPTGIFPSVYKVYAGTTSLDSAGHNVFRLFSGYGLFALAFVFRSKGFLHKRFMLGCMVMLTSAAIFRISFDVNMQDNQLFNKGFQILPALLLFLLDWANRKKVVLIDLISPVLVLGIFFLADYFWLSSVGELAMNLLISIFVKTIV